MRIVAAQWNEAYAPVPVAAVWPAGDPSEQSTQIYLNGEIFDEGGVAVAIGGSVRLASVIFQGCTADRRNLGRSRGGRNLIHEIGKPPRLRGAGQGRLTAFQSRRRKSRMAISSSVWS